MENNNGKLFSSNILNNKFDMQPFTETIISLTG